MKRKDSRSVRAWSVLGKAALLAFLAAAAIDGTHRAAADGTGGETPPPPDDEVEPWDGHVPNTPYDDGPDAIPITEVSPGEQAAIHEMGERSDVGASTHAAWSAAVHSIAAEAAVQRAAHQSGTAGLESVGVEP